MVGGLALVYMSYLTARVLWLQDLLPIRSFIGSLLIVAIAFSATFARSEWRKRRLHYLEARSHLMSGLVGIGIQGVRRVQQGSTTDEEIKNVLQRVAAIVALNPWAFFQRIEAFIRRRPLGTVCLWYHEKQISTKTCCIRAYVAIDPPAVVAVALEKIKEGFKAPPHDATWFSKQLASYTEGNQIDSRRLISHGDRESHTSLVGYTMEYKTALSSRDGDAALYFNSTFRKHIEQDSKDRLVSAWTDVRSYSASAVIDQSINTPEPLGALVLWKNVDDGLSPEDDRVIALAAKMIALIVSAERQLVVSNERKVS